VSPVQAVKLVFATRNRNKVRELSQMLTLGVDVSSDGKTVALAIPNEQTGTFDIWLLERDRNLRTRLTFGPESEFPPVFSPDDKWVAYTSDTSGPANIYRKPVSGGGKAELLLGGDNDTYPTDISPDGKILAFTEIDSTGGINIGLLDIENGEVVRKFQDPAYMHLGGQFSPDGKWIAYVSNETGSREIFAESVEPGQGRWRVSSNSGMYPSWAANEDKLFYTTPDGSLMATEVTINPSGLAFGETRVVTTGLVISNAISYAEDPSNGDLIVLKTSQSRDNSMLYLITGWPQLLANNN
jgi:Tol biopolymer transport system component